MLSEILRLYDTQPAAYWTTALLATCAMFGWIAWVSTPRGQAWSTRAQALGTGLMLLVVIFAWRWPPLFGSQEFNPDESQLIAGALTLKQDPVFWRSVDGTTSGPLNFYALLPVHALGVPLDYFTARLSGLLMVWGAFWALYALLRHEFSAGATLIGLAPGWTMIAVVTDRDFIHYSSEHFSVLLVAVSAWLLWRAHCLRLPGQPFARLPWLSAGLLMGMLPWAKLQSSPLAATLAAWGTYLALTASDLPWWVRVREVAVLAAAALATSVFFFASILGYGLWEHFYTCYIENNLIYASTDFTIQDSVRKLEMLSSITHSVHALAVAPLMALGIGVISWFLRPRWPNTLLWPGLAFVAVALATAIAPRQGFQHYLLYVIPVLAWLGAVAYAEVMRVLDHPSKRVAWSIAFVLLGTGSLIANRTRLTDFPPLGMLQQSWEEPFSPQGKLIRAHKRPGDAIAVWGWDCQVYVEARLPHATREAHSTRQLWDSPQRETYYRPRYMADLKANRPAFFVDATGGDAFFFYDRPRWQHETFPELRAYIAEHYVLMEDFVRSRVYLRKDRYREYYGEVP